MFEEIKTTVMEKPIVAVVIMLVGAVVGFFVSPSIRKTLRMKR